MKIENVGSKTNGGLKKSGFSFLGKNFHVKNLLFHYTLSNIAFTLVELLITIAIITILASLLLPSLKQTMNFAKRTTCMNNQKQCGLALLSYSNDYSDYILPHTKGGSGANKAYWNRWYGCLMMLDYLPLKNPLQTFDLIVRCPLGFLPKDLGDESLWNTTYGLRTTYIDASQTYAWIKLSSVKSPSSTIWMSDTLYVGGSFPDGVQNLYFDGGFNWYDGVCESVLRLIHTRHGGKANTWFIDGHVGACDPLALRNYAGKTLDYYDMNKVRTTIP